MSPSGPNKNDVRAKNRKERPPMTATVFSDILAASILPPMTARPVQKACPRRPPNTFCVQYTHREIIVQNDEKRFVNSIYIPKHRKYKKRT